MPWVATDRRLLAASWGLKGGVRWAEALLLLLLPGLLLALLLLLLLLLLPEPAVAAALESVSKVNRGAPTATVSFSAAWKALSRPG